ncbi:helix-turn-helix domain-containing protein [Streptomyces sp. BI20]|uniref:helix-turn-helix domain-containing protein n=1 Tax=Streptomyces sp. BI20 TaxID=3403460 RepID=UPI003C745713
MVSSDPDRGKTVSTVLGRRLGGELLAMRERLGLRQSHAAEALTASITKVAKMERGQVPMRDPDIRALCHLYGVRDEETIQPLLELAKLDREQRRTKGWWNEFPEISALAEYISLEATASLIRTWQLALVPGLLQTPGYVRALNTGPGSEPIDPDRLERIVNIRLRRHARLTGENPLRFHAIIWEAAVRSRFASEEVVREQAEHIVRMAELPNVDVQILPFSTGALPGMDGPFNVLSFAEGDAIDVVYAENRLGASWGETATQGALYKKSFETLAQYSLSPQESISLLGDLAKGTT